jgi:hypothetical protein
MVASVPDEDVAGAGVLGDDLGVCVVAQAVVHDDVVVGCNQRAAAAAIAAAMTTMPPTGSTDQWDGRGSRSRRATGRCSPGDRDPDAGNGRRRARRLAVADHRRIRMPAEFPWASLPATVPFDASRIKMPRWLIPAGKRLPAHGGVVITVRAAGPVLGHRGNNGVTCS